MSLSGDDCQPGEFASDRRSTRCEVCTPGRWNAGFAQKLCVVAQAGYYANGTGALEQRACPPGRFSRLDEADHCDECAIGYFQENPTSKSCQQATKGNFVNSTGARRQTPCEPGRFSDVEGWTKPCLLCERGKAQDQAGRTSCADCTGNEFAPGVGYAKCQQCDATAQVNDNGDACICKPGRSRPPALLSCGPWMVTILDLQVSILAPSTPADRRSTASRALTALIVRPPSVAHVL
jgi:hypothetical protein